MISEKLYEGLQAMCIYYSIISMVIYGYYKDKKYTGEHPVLNVVYSMGFDLVWQIGCFFLIKLLVRLLIFMFNSNIDSDYGLKTTWVIFTMLTINDAFYYLYKTGKESRIHTQLANPERNQDNDVRM